MDKVSRDEFTSNLQRSFDITEKQHLLVMEQVNELLKPEDTNERLLQYYAALVHLVDRLIITGELKHNN